jgi:mxaA protein
MRRMAACAAAVFTASPGHAQIRSVTPQTVPRDFGYFAGDIMTGTAVITVSPGTTLDMASVPEAGPVAPSIDIRRVRVEHSAQRYVVHVTYQSFAAPERVARFDVPAYTLQFSGAGEKYAAQVQGFGFTASVFRNDLASVLNASVLRPDPPEPIATAHGALQWLVAGVALMAGATGLLWWDAAGVTWRRGKPAPFAVAARRIAALKGGAASEDTTLALLDLHRAFDATAGSRVLADDLDMFFTNHGRFAGLREDVTRVFASSREMFFAGGQSGAALSLGALTKLSRALMLAERGR